MGKESDNRWDGEDEDGMREEGWNNENGVKVWPSQRQKLCPGWRAISKRMFILERVLIVAVPTLLRTHTICPSWPSHFQKKLGGSFLFCWWFFLCQECGGCVSFKQNDHSFNHWFQKIVFTCHFDFFVFLLFLLCFWRHEWKLICWAMARNKTQQTWRELAKCFSSNHAFTSCWVAWSPLWKEIPNSSLQWHLFQQKCRKSLSTLFSLVFQVLQWCISLSPTESLCLGLSSLSSAVDLLPAALSKVWFMDEFVLFTLKLMNEVTQNDPLVCMHQKQEAVFVFAWFIDTTFFCCLAAVKCNCWLHGQHVQVEWLHSASNASITAMQWQQHSDKEEGAKIAGDQVVWKHCSECDKSGITTGWHFVVSSAIVSWHDMPNMWILLPCSDFCFCVCDLLCHSASWKSDVTCAVENVLITLGIEQVNRCNAFCLCRRMHLTLDGLILIDLVSLFQALQRCMRSILINHQAGICRAKIVCSLETQRKCLIWLPSSWQFIKQLTRWLPFWTHKKATPAEWEWWNNQQLQFDNIQPYPMVTLQVHFTKLWLWHKTQSKIENKLTFPHCIEGQHWVKPKARSPKKLPHLLGEFMFFQCWLQKCSCLHVAAVDHHIKLGLLCVWFAPQCH